jgi:hypothetical protein
MYKHPRKSAGLDFVLDIGWLVLLPTNTVDIQTGATLGGKLEKKKKENQ